MVPVTLGASSGSGHFGLTMTGNGEARARLQQRWFAQWEESRVPAEPSPWLPEQPSPRAGVRLEHFLIDWNRGWWIPTNRFI